MANTFSKTQGRRRVTARHDNLQSSPLKSQASHETSRTSDARERLIQAALRLFSERGFDGTGIRDLAEAAGVNVAAVNYHFGSKENLRLETLRYGLAPTVKMREETQGYLDQARHAGTITAAEQALRKFIRRFLTEVLTAGSSHWALLMHEFTMPSPAFKTVMQEYLVPQDAILVEILKLLLPDADEVTVRHCVGSIMGQCFHARNAAPLMRIMGMDPSAPDFVEVRAEHIANFSLFGIKAFAKARQQTKT